MKLSEKEARIYTAIQFQGDVPLADISRKLKMKEHTVRYAVRSMIENGLIRPLAIINTFALGLTEYNFSFSLNSGKPEMKQRLLQDLKKDQRVGWLNECSGEFQYQITVYARQLHEAGKFLSDLSARHGDIFFQKIFTGYLQWESFSRRYLTPNALFSHISIYPPDQQPKLDSLDYEILREISHSPLATLEQLSKKIDRPITTVSYRLKQLRKEKILLSLGYALNFRDLGIHAHRLLIHGKGIGPNLFKDLQQFCKKNPNALTLIACLGNWDYEIRVEAYDFATISSVTEGLYEACGNRINTIRTLTLLDQPIIAQFGAALSTAAVSPSQ